MRASSAALRASSARVSVLTMLACIVCTSTRKFRTSSTRSALVWAVSPALCAAMFSVASARACAVATTCASCSVFFVWSLSDTGGRTAQALPKETQCNWAELDVKEYNYNREMVHYIPPLHWGGKTEHKNTQTIPTSRGHTHRTYNMMLGIQTVQQSTKSTHHHSPP